MPALSGFVNGGYEMQSRVVAGEETINCFPESIPQGGKAKSALLPAPGLSTFATLTESPGRGAFAHDGRLWAVGGRQLYEIDSTGVATSRGTLANDGNPATFDTNGDGGGQLMITSGGLGYILDLTTHALTTPLSSGASMCGQLDGFLVSLNATTSTMRISESLDGSTWSGTQIAQRTSASDPWVAMIVARGEVYLFGDKTGEAWYNAGLSPFPLAARPEGFFETGIAAPYSLTRFGSGIAWLGRTEHGNPKAYRMEGYTPVQISTPAMDWLIQTFDDAVGIEDAVGWSYDREGHSFYVLTFPSSNRTYVYDGTTQKWHRRGYWDAAQAQLLEYRPIFHAHCFNRNIVLDSDSARVYALSSTTYTDVGGDPLRRVRRMPHVSRENKRLYFSDVELECDRGVGTVAGQGSDPVVGLRASNDGGHTWGASRMRNIGKIGDYSTRVRWENCGSGRDRVWELWSTDPAPTRWFDFYVNAEVGVH